MRTARLVGPTADGTAVVLVTEDGEELTVALPGDGVDDPAARALLGQASTTADPGDAAPPPAVPVRRPPRRRESPVDTPLTPRDIQTRIRGGESLEDVVAGSGMDAERVERFAAPVLAEREHLALTALAASVRRRGESSGARPLRTVVAERLLGQGVDADDVGWDAWKRDDGAWQVTADYELRDEPRHAEFRYDPQGRFSLAEDDEARWLAGERPSPVAASVDRDDELALVRATRELDDGPAAAAPDAEHEEASSREDLAAAALEVAEELGAVLSVVPPVELSTDELDELAADDPESDDAEPMVEGAGAPDDSEPDVARPEDTQPDDSQPDDTEPTLVAPRDEAAEPTIAVVRRLTRVTVEVEPEDQDSDDAGARSALDTLYDMLGGDGYAEESPRVYPGLSDATAVPEVDEHDFEPADDVLVPVEPDPEPEATATTLAEVDADDPAPVVPDANDEPGEPLIPSPGATRKPGRRKRASVPSWDEIMFGGPKPG